MKENIKLEIERSLNKIRNIKENVEEIRIKISKLEEHIKSLNASLDAEKERIELLGLKGPSKDPTKPDTEETKRKKEEYNVKLKAEKDKLINEKLPAMEMNPTVRDFISDMFKI